MSFWLHKAQKYLLTILVLNLIVVFNVPGLSLAATASPASDQITRLKISTPANHTIQFKTPTGIDAPGDTISIDFPSFNLGAIGVGDIDLFHGPVTGLENADVLGAAAGIGVWGVNIAGATLTLTPPTNAAPGTVLPNDLVTIYIGTQAAGGVNQIINPAVAGQYLIQINGAFGDSNQIAVAILNDDSVIVSATVPSSLSITSLVPSSVTAGAAAFTMTINGFGFLAGSVARLDGADRATTYVSSTVIQAQILVGDVSTEGSRAITVWNPVPGVLSNSLNLTVNPTGNGGGGGGTPSPSVISNVHCENAQSDSFRVLWDTDTPANSVVNYGLTIGYGNSLSNDSQVFSHSLDLSGLSPSTVYHYTVSSRDQYNQTTSAGDFTCSTVASPPVTISNFIASCNADTSALVSWDTNHAATTRVDYGLTAGLGSWMESGDSVINHHQIVTGLTADTTYYFRGLSQDAYGSVATSSIVSCHTTSDTTPPTNVILTATPGDTVVLLQWTIPPEPDLAGVRIRRRADGFPTGPNDGVLVYDGTASSTLDVGLTNGTTYYYAAYAYDTHGNFASGSLASATPLGNIVLPPPPPPATTTPPTPPQPPTPPTAPATTTPPIIPPSPTVPGLTITALYYTANGTILLQPDEQGNFGVLGGSTVRVYVPTANLGSTPQYAVMDVAGHAYTLTLNADGTSYTGSFQAPESGTFTSSVRVSLQNGRTGTAENPFVVQYSGQTIEQTLLPTPTPQPIPGAQVTLYEQRGGQWVPWNASPYAQSNPMTTDERGDFFFAVPNGRYYAVIEKPGYDTVRTPSVTISNNSFGGRVPMVRQPIPTTSTLPLITNLPGEVAYVALKTKNILTSPEVTGLINNSFLPGLLAIGVLNTFTALPLFNLLSFFQFLFTQPILLFARKKMKRWGVVYNALSKQPIEFAVVRLIHYESHLVVQTRVTDKQGRYVFYTKPGNYLLEVSKPGYAFPSQYLSHLKEDGGYVELYHGEMLALAEEASVAFNIPMDPVVKPGHIRSVAVQRWFRSGQHAVALTSVLLALLIVLILQTWPALVLFIVQLGFYLLFRRLAMPAQSKPWGKIYDRKTKRAIKNAVVRIFDKKYNKLLETIITDNKGRYGFFADKNIFYVTVEKPGYAKFTSEDIDLVNTHKETIVDFNVGLKPALVKG